VRPRPVGECGREGQVVGAFRVNRPPVVPAPVDTVGIGNDEPKAIAQRVESGEAALLRTVAAMTVKRQDERHAPG
jgi:hypothetical protein